jgi:hypothetical protein
LINDSNIEIGISEIGINYFQIESVYIRKGINIKGILLEHSIIHSNSNILKQFEDSGEI